MGSLAKGHYMDLANAGLDTIPGSGEQDSGGIAEGVPSHLGSFWIVTCLHCRPHIKCTVESGSVCNLP